MNEADDPRPLGPPLPRPGSELPEWLPLPGSPHIEVNRHTGKWRNVTPPPRAEGAPYAVPPWPFPTGGKP